MKRVTMVYFSPTGTTEKILESIAAGMGEDDPQKINATLPSGREELDRLFAQRQAGTHYWLIGAPVYSGKLPPLMHKQLMTLNGKGAPAAAVVVYGNRDYGIALKQLVALLASRDFKVTGAGAFVAEHSFSRMFPIALGRPDGEDLEKARAFGEKISAKGREAALISPDRLEGDIELLIKLLPDHGPRPTVVQEKCTGCLTCVNSCPLGLIDQKTKVHRDEKAVQLCLGCLSCVKRCPSDARTFHIPAPIRRFLNNFVFKEALSLRREPFVLL